DPTHSGSQLSSLLHVQPSPTQLSSGFRRSSSPQANQNSAPHNESSTAAGRCFTPLPYQETSARRIAGSCARDDGSAPQREELAFAKGLPAGLVGERNARDQHHLLLGGGRVDGEALHPEAVAPFRAPSGEQVQTRGQNPTVVGLRTPVAVHKDDV